MFSRVRIDEGLGRASIAASKEKDQQSTAQGGARF